MKQSISIMSWIALFSAIILNEPGIYIIWAALVISVFIMSYTESRYMTVWEVKKEFRDSAFMNSEGFEFFELQNIFYNRESKYGVDPSRDWLVIASIDAMIENEQLQKFLKLYCRKMWQKR